MVEAKEVGKRETNKAMFKYSTRRKKERKSYLKNRKERKIPCC